MKTQNKAITDIETNEVIQEHYNAIIMPEMKRNMYKMPIYENTGLDINESVEGETIEMKVERIVNNNEPIKDGAPIIYTERGKGVEPQYNIRTDRWELAVDAMDKVSKSHMAKREEYGKVIDLNTDKPVEGQQDPIQGNKAE